MWLPCRMAAGEEAQPDASDVRPPVAVVGVSADSPGRVDPETPRAAGKEEGSAPVGADPRGGNGLWVVQDDQRRCLLRRGCEMSLAISHAPALNPT